MHAARVPPSSASAAKRQPGFFLKDGDRVVFYGDSITEQRLYTTFAETYVVTRFPKLDVRFVHSGWGGDRVTGGGGGSIDKRLERDVIAHKPTVVTIMLGMNDGRYRPLDTSIFRAFTTGYEHLLQMLKEALPQTRVTLIRPSPYDEITRSPLKGKGYNPVLVKMGDFLEKIARREGYTVADLNSDLVGVLKRASSEGVLETQKIIKDRVHPGPAGHLIMAGSLLDAWQAPALVTEVGIDAKAGKVVVAKNTAVTGFDRSDKGLAWTQEDAGLPFPVNMTDPPTALAVRSSSFVQHLNRQPLRVTGLGAGDHRVLIDDEEVGVFKAEQLAKGINLAELPTPMIEQAGDVHALTLKHVGIHHTRWRTFQVPFEEEELTKLDGVLTALDALEEEIVAKQRQAAQPVPHKFLVSPVETP